MGQTQMLRVFENSGQLKHDRYTNIHIHTGETKKGKITKFFAFHIFAVFANTIKDVFNVC